MRTIQIIIFILILHAQGLSINPMKEYKMRPTDFNISYNEQKLITTDGFELNTWVMEPAEEKRKNITILIVGSDAGNMGFNLPYAFHLLNSGYRVVTFDYRGFGESDDFEYNLLNVYHTEYITDFTTVLNWCKENIIQERIGVLSFSMGTLISSIGYSNSSFDFYIGEGFILSPKLNQQRVEIIKNKKLTLPDSADQDEIKIDQLNIPILLFASVTDKITTAEDSLDFCKNRNKAKTIEHDGEHLRGFVALGVANYIDLIDEFIESNRG